MRAVRPGVSSCPLPIATARREERVSQRTGSGNPKPHGDVVPASARSLRSLEAELPLNSRGIGARSVFIKRCAILALR